MRRVKTSAGMVCGLLAVLACNAWAADDAVLLQHGDLRITESYFKQLVSSIVPEKDRAEFMSDQGRLRKMLLDTYVVESLALEAKNKGLDKAPEVVFRQQYQAKKDLAQLYLGSLQDDDKKQPNWEQLAKESYIANPEKFKLPEQVSASHILIAINDTRTEAQAAERAAEAHKRAVAKESFAALVKEYSDDPSAAQNQGNLGFFGAGNMVKPFEDVAFAMNKAGEISQPFKTQFGYHIIQFNERKPAGAVPFAQVKDQLIAQEREKFAAVARERKLVELRDAAGADVNKEAIDDLVLRMAQEAKAAKDAQSAKAQ